MKSLLRILRLITFPLTLLSGLLLTLSALVPFIHPSYSTWLQLLGLAFPILFLINVLWLFFWWFQLKFKLIVPLCFLIFNLIGASKYVQYTRDRKPPAQSMKVSTYNCMLFGAYQNGWFFDTIVSTLRNHGDDVVCLQEVYAKKDLENHIRSLRKNGGFKMYSLYRLTPDRPYGMAILSKYRILKSGRIDFPGNTGNMAMWADVERGTDTLRIYNVHLQSIRFRKSDYDFVSQKNGTDYKKGSRNLLLRMREAYEKRAAQAERVAAHLKQCPYPVVLTGDFNDVPLSYAYRTVSKDLLDAFTEAGNGIERTYKGPFPSFRIDYILFSKNLGCTAYNSTLNIPGDHKFISATLDLGKLPGSAKP
ncbi:MAG: endonuclease/exonuclease/phosphatase family protein [Bacteroidetes bacterium]|nr:endonuclease/exonuclease/phosphatase family protein [Bacteroidota bacterium]